MNVEIMETREQPLLERKVVKASLTFEGATPSRKKVLTALANQLKAKEGQACQLSAPTCRVSCPRCAKQS